MTDPPPVPVTVIKPISELFRGDCVALWATTYNLGLALFNGYLLGRLGDPPLNAVVLADRDRLDATLEAIPAERLDVLAAVNRRWLLRGARLGAGRFHPKSYLAVTARTAKLLIGSGNLSTDGLDTGREVFTGFAAGTPDGDAAIATWLAWMRRLIAAVDDTRLAERFADLEARLPTPPGPTLVADSPLWHNLDQPLGQQLVAAVAAQTGIVDELIVTAPYYDEDGEALGQLADRLSPKRLRVYTSSFTNVNGARLAARLTATGADIEALAYLPDRFTHAKLVGVIAGGRGWLLSGSANLSHAALTQSADPGNVELTVFTELPANTVRAAFLPPDVTAEARPFASLGELTFDGGTDEDEAVPPTRITRATLLTEGRIHFAADPAPDTTWRLADHETAQALTVDGSTATTTGPLAGPLVHLIDPDGTVVSNRVVVDDPDALARALQVGERTGSTRPPELTTADLDTPLGAALLWLHQNMVMDIAERAGAGGAAAATRDESADASGDDSLWERLERETLGRDPRAGTYGRLFSRGTGMAGGPTEPLVELLDAMRHRVPAEADSAGSRLRSLLVLLTRSNGEESSGDGAHQPGAKWSPSARIRVRARNVLRRWAAAQTDPRLVWVDPLAPLGNLATIAAVFATLWRRNAEPGSVVELEQADLDELWARWFRPFVGTGQNDGWIDHAEVDADRLRAQLTGDFTENAVALCWLAIRPGPDRRARRVAWQPFLYAAFERSLMEVNEAVADYLTVVTGRPITVDQVTEDILETLDFIDDDLWCDQTTGALGLEQLRLEATSAGQRASVRLLVQGVDNPLYDPRIPSLVAAVRRYRSTDAVALFGPDHDWRIVVAADEPIVFKANLDAPVLESSPLRPDAIDVLAASQGVLADLFPADARVA